MAHKPALRRKKSSRPTASGPVSPGLGIRNHQIQRAIDSGRLGDAEAQLRDEGAAVRLDPILLKWFEAKLAEVKGSIVKARSIVDAGLELVRNSRVDNRSYWLAHFLRKAGLFAWHALETKKLEERLTELQNVIENDGTLHYLGADALILRGHLLEAQGRNGAAVDQYYQAEQVAKDTNDDRRRLRALSLGGRAYRFLKGHHLPDSRKMLEEALKLAQFLNMKLAELRVKMFLIDLDRASGGPKCGAYRDLRVEAAAMGFGTLALRLDARILDERGGQAHAEEVSAVIHDFETAGCHRLALLHSAKAVGRRTVAGNGQRGNGGEVAAQVRDVVASVRALERPSDATLVVRDLARAVVRLHGHKVEAGITAVSTVETLLHKLEDLSDRNPRNQGLHSEEHADLVSSLLEALSPASPLNLVRANLSGTMQATFDAIAELQSRCIEAGFVHYGEIASRLPRDRGKEITVEATRKRCSHLEKELNSKSGASGITLERRGKQGCRLKGPGID